VTHEWVRHRIGVAYSQESTRYCDYAKIIEKEFTEGTDAIAQIKFIRPVDFELDDSDMILLARIEAHYFKCIAEGRTPQQARYFLPNGLKTEIVVTANIRAWRHIFGLRCAPKAHPQMRALMIPVLNDFNHCLPVLFHDLHQEYGGVYKGAETC
jgi:thymidylate synthase (FAD)